MRLYSVMLQHLSQFHQLAHIVFTALAEHSMQLLEDHLGSWVGQHPDLFAKGR